MLKISQNVIPIIFAGLCFFALNIHAEERDTQTTPENFPTDFTFQEKPIDPMCVTKLLAEGGSPGHAVDLLHCSQHPENKIEKVDHKLIKKGYTGFDYTYQVSPQYVAHGISYYKYLGKFKDQDILYVIESGGGSGFMSSLILVKRDKNKLQLVKVIASGDRCNGGINENVEYKNEKLTFRVNITAYEMIRLSKALTEPIKPYDDLADCAACCVGEAIYENDLNQSEGPKLISVKIEKSVDSETEQGKYQSCFNELIHNYRIAEKYNFNPNDLKIFGENFYKKCKP
jgi:hypothetical protein